MKNPTNVVYYMRRRMGITQEQISKETNLTKNDVSRIEKGVSTYIEKYIKLAQYFNIPLDALLNNNIVAIFPVLSEISQIDRKLMKRIKVQREKNDV